MWEALEDIARYQSLIQPRRKSVILFKNIKHCIQSLQLPFIIVRVTNEYSHRDWRC